jgi:hypothetical protein
MRTTIDLPPHIHRLARSIAQDRGETLSQAVVELIERGLHPLDAPRITVSPRTGLPVMTLGGPPVTDADARALEDDEDEYLASRFERSTDAS